MMQGFHVIQVIPNDRGGGAERIVEVLHAGLRQNGISCETVYFTGTERTHENKTWFGRRHDSPASVRGLRALLRARLREKDGPLILHSHLTRGFYAALVARSGLPVRWVHTEHNTTTRLREINFMGPIEKRCYLRCDKVIVVSKGVWRSLNSKLAISDKKIELIYNGTKNYGFFPRPDISDRPLRFVSVGSLTRKKGFDIILQALGQAKIGSWNYTIVGDGPELGQVESLARRLGLSKKVTFAGWSNEPDRYYREADVQLIPSRWEGFGLVAVEGMSTGLRVIASDVEGLREVLGDDAGIRTLVKNHLDPASWARALETFVAGLKGDPSSKACANMADLFSVESMVAGYIDMYRRLACPDEAEHRCACKDATAR